MDVGDLNAQVYLALAHMDLGISSFGASDFSSLFLLQRKTFSY